MTRHAPAANETAAKPWPTKRSAERLAFAGNTETNIQSAKARNASVVMPCSAAAGHHATRHVSCPTGAVSENEEAMTRKSVPSRKTRRSRPPPQRSSHPVIPNTSRLATNGQGGRACRSGRTTAATHPARARIVFTDASARMVADALRATDGHAARFEIGSRCRPTDTAAMVCRCRSSSLSASLCAAARAAAQSISSPSQTAATSGARGPPSVTLHFLRQAGERATHGLPRRFG